MDKKLSNYLTEEYLKEFTYRVGDESIFLPKKESIANFCYIEEIESKRCFYSIILRIENEYYNISYKKKYFVYPGRKIKLNILQPNLLFCLPPEKIPIVLRINSINKDVVGLQVSGIRK